MSEPDDFLLAITRGEREQVAAMLAENPALANARGSSGLPAVMTALYYQEPEIAELLADNGAELDLFSAAALGRAEWVREMLEANGSGLSAYSSDGFQAVHLAAFFGRTEVMAALLERGAEANCYSENDMHVQPIHSAVAGRHLEITRMLLEHGADPNAAQGEGFTPLQGAAQNGQMEMVALLLAHGADPRQKNDRGQTAADIAAEAGHTEVAARLK